MLVIAAIAFAWIARSFRSEDAGPRAHRETAQRLAAD
jgi:hypothetical protein